MIPVPTGVRVWQAMGHTDMRRGMNSLAIQVQEGLGRDPYAGDLYVFPRQAREVGDIMHPSVQKPRSRRVLSSWKRL